MPDLGEYATYVGLAYAVSLALLAGLVATSVWRGKRVKRQLAEAEARRGHG
jgi:heme exporter protein D